MDDIEKSLALLKSLLDRGLIEESEFNRRRQVLLDGAFGASDPSPGSSGASRRRGTETGLAKGMRLGSDDRPYRLEDPLGEGAMGEVWKAEDIAESETLGRPSWKALKILREELARDPVNCRWIKTEAIAASRLRHANIVHIIDWREDSNTHRPFIVMEWLEGRSLYELLAEEGDPGLPWERVLELIAPIADALTYAWEKHQLVHRDIKPENVFLTKKGEVKLLDFGIAAQARKSSMVVGSEGREAAGTAGYRAPEANAHQRQPAPSLDVYSLGVMVYELLEGRPPFTGVRTREHLPDPLDGLNARQWQALQRGFAYDAKDRFETAKKFLEALRNAEGPEVRRSGEAQIEVIKPPEIERPSWRAGEVFRDGPDCPEMVVIPPGEFLMGSAKDDKEAYDAERPQHRVKIGYWFAVGKYPVTFEEWDACVAAGGCDRDRPNDNGWGRGMRPVINVSWDDAQTYIMWLKQKTGKNYRLLSEAEWEYAARAGTTTRYFWSDEIGRNNANCDGCGSQWDKKQTSPVGSFKPNAFGLHDMHGNVWEWTEDCWNESYNGAPSNGSARTSGEGSRRVLRGGSWSFGPRDLRSAYRGRRITASRFYDVGFRVARTQ